MPFDSVSFAPLTRQCFGRVGMNHALWSPWRGLTCEVFPRVKVRDHVGGSKPRLGNRAVARLRGGI